MLGYWGAKAVSRAQLPRILAGVDGADLNELVAEHFGIRIEFQNKEWYAIDGKTLSGVAGQRERVLLGVSHTGRRTVAQQPMHGTKKSEITAVREMLAQTGLEKGNNTLAALHFNPTTTGQINQAGGQFVIQLKANQPHLLEQMSQEAAEARPLGILKTVEKGHGRLEIRQGTFFKINHLQVDPRWTDSGLVTLIVMARRTPELTTQKRSAEVSFYCSNVALDPADAATQPELFQAIRGHWGWKQTITFEMSPFKKIRSGLNTAIKLRFWPRYGLWPFSYFGKLTSTIFKLLSKRLLTVLTSLKLFLFNTVFYEKTVRG